jgi:hypothetical protein
MSGFSFPTSRHNRRDRVVHGRSPISARPAKMGRHDLRRARRFPICRKHPAMDSPIKSANDGMGEGAPLRRRRYFAVAASAWP